MSSNYNKIEHKMVGELDDALSARFQACCLNYNKYIVELFGDNSLSKRPMKRIIEPLELMGAKISSNDFKSLQIKTVPHLLLLVHTPEIPCKGIT